MEASSSISFASFPSAIMLPLLGAHILAAMSPGANTLLTLEAASQSRQAGLVTAAGFWPAGVLWSILGMWGVGAALWTAPRFVLVFHTLAALYLAWLAWQMVKKSAPQTSNQPAAAALKTQTHSIQTQAQKPSNPYLRSLYVKAFVTNLFNPKSMVYFSSVFTATKATQLPLLWKWVAILGLPLIGFFWYASLVMLVTHPRLAPLYQAYAHWVARLAGCLLLLLALQLLRSAWYG